MKACNIIINGVELDTEEFKKYVKAGDPQALATRLGLEELPDTLRRLLVRFGIDQMEDSVMEMQAKRNAAKAGVDLGSTPSKDEVEYWIYPQGQFNDYQTQNQIQQNTTSGLKLTGISANSGKTLAYLFEGTPVTEITNIVTGDKFEGERIGKLLNSNKIDTITELLKRFPQYQVSKREDIKLKPTSHWKLDQHSFNTFNRFEKDTKTGEDKRLPISNLKISIFETIDTIINLAIDNVKEQKLFTYGITNSNANAFFAAIATGAPLNEVVKIFTSPIVRSISTSGRITPELLSGKAKLIEEEIGTKILSLPKDVLDNFLTKAQYTALTKQLSTELVPREEMAERVLRYIGNNGSINTKVLDAIYKEEPISDLSELLSDLVVLRTLAKLATVGEEMFVNAQLFSLLRKMPGSMSSIEYLSERPLEYNDFSFMAELDENTIKEYKRNAIEYVKLNDPEYLKMTPQEQDNYIKKLESVLSRTTSEKMIAKEISSEFTAKFRNAMAYSTLRRQVKPSNKSVFENMSALSIPHVYSAWKTLNLLKNVTERAFAINNPLLKSFMTDLVDKAGMFTNFNKFELVEQMILEFFKAISSGLTLEVNGDLLNMDTDNITYSVGEFNLKGPEAWSQRFLKDLVQVKADDTTYNRFLDSIEIESNNGLLKLSLYADKIDDVKIKEGIRQDFMKLYNDPNTKHIALDVFKYSILTEGLLYARSNLSLIFPPSFISAYSRSFSDAISYFTTTNKRLVLARLSTMGNIFLYQFLRNFPDTVGFISGYKPESTGTVVINDNVILKYSGVDNVKGAKVYNAKGVKVYYDLKYPGMYSSSAKKFIKRFGNEIFMKIDTGDSRDTYYRQITSGSRHSFYDIRTTEDFQKVFELDRLSAMGMVVPNTLLNGTVIDFGHINPELKEGDIIQVFDILSARPESIRRYRVKNVRNKSIYDLEIEKAEPLFTQSELLFNQYPVLTTSNASTVVNTAQGRIKTVSRAMADPQGYSIVSGDTPRVPNSMGIPKSGTESDYKDVLKLISKLDPSKHYYVENRLLDELDPQFGKLIAEALYKKIGYVDKFSDRLLQLEEDSISLYYKLKSMTQNRPHFVGGYSENDAYNPDVLNQLNEKGLVTLEWKKQSVFKKVKEGDIIFLGMMGSSPQFAYVNSINFVASNPVSMDISLIPSRIAVQMVQDNYTLAEYDALLEENKLDC